MRIQIDLNELLLTIYWFVKKKTKQKLIRCGFAMPATKVIQKLNILFRSNCIITTMKSIVVPQSSQIFDKFLRHLFLFCSVKLNFLSDCRLILICDANK